MTNKLIKQIEKFAKEYSEIEDECIRRAYDDTVNYIVLDNCRSYEGLEILNYWERLKND